MMSGPDPTYLGTVQDVAGSTVSVVLDQATGSGLMFVDGAPYRVGQVGSYVRLPLGFSDLIGIVARAGVGAVPERLAAEEPFGRRWVTVELIGTSSPTRGFQRGVEELPALGDPVHLATEADLGVVFGVSESLERIRLGTIAGAGAVAALLDLNSLVSRHVAVVGTTGAGKSSTVAHLVGTMSDPDRYPSARVLVLDVHGEYVNAFDDRAVAFSVSGRTGERLNVPYWALSFEELIPITFGSLPDDAALGAVRDEIVRLKREAFQHHPREGLTSELITVDTPIPFSIHRLWFDLHRTLNATHTERGTGQSSETEALEVDQDGNPVEPGDALTVVPPRYQAATQAAGVPKIFLSGSQLNIRRQVDGLASRLRDPRFDFLFRPGDWTPSVDGDTTADLDGLLDAWLGGPEPVTVLDLSGAPASILTEVVGALTRVLYDAIFWARRLSEGGRERPLLMVFEEAHAYLDSSSSPAASAAVRRVVKEGRKYGIGAMIVSQRPAEIDATILSQCGTMVALRLANATDRGRVTAAVSENLAGLLSILPSLRTGEAIVVGEAVPMPMRTLVDMPTHVPDSSDPLVVTGSGEPGGWNRGREPSDYKDVVQRWRSSDPVSNRIVTEESS